MDGSKSSIEEVSVALRKESVDRNTQRRDFKVLGLLSLSARRAWIEMGNVRGVLVLRKSLSARRAWIEISGVMRQNPGKHYGRSPQGERG